VFTLCLGSLAFPEEGCSINLRQEDILDDLSEFIDFTEMLEYSENKFSNCHLTNDAELMDRFFCKDHIIPVSEIPSITLSYD
jgi:hypothetical protein